MEGAWLVGKGCGQQIRVIMVCCLFFLYSDIHECGVSLGAAPDKESKVSVNYVLWRPERSCVRNFPQFVGRGGLVLEAFCNFCSDAAVGTIKSTENLQSTLKSSNHSFPQSCL